MRRFLAAILLGALAVLTPTGSAFAEATTTTTVMRVPWGFTPLVNPCTGESLDMSGMTLIVTHTTIDGTGAGHTRFHFNAQDVEGVSQTTGITYRLVDTVNTTFYDGPLPTVLTNVATFRLVGPGPGNDQVLRFQQHFTINANGELTSFVFNQVNECR